VCDARQVKSSFKKLMKACVPSCSGPDQNLSFLRCLEESEWMVLVRTASEYTALLLPAQGNRSKLCVCVCVSVCVCVCGCVCVCV